METKSDKPGDKPVKLEVRGLKSEGKRLQTFRLQTSDFPLVSSQH
jgi:hypothetical protein